MNNSSRLYNLDVDVTPHTSYLICATPRVGSNLLCEMLIATGLAGMPQEFFIYGDFAKSEQECVEKRLFQDWALSNNDYIKKIFREGVTSNGVLGVKIMQHHFEAAIKKLRCFCPNVNGDIKDIIEFIFPNLHYVYLVREDKVRQAVSLAMALQTDRWIEIDPSVLNGKIDPYIAKLRDWYKSQESLSSKHKISYDFNFVESLYKEIIFQNRKWNFFFSVHNINPLHVKYEDLLLSGEETTIRILNYLNIKVPEKMFFRKGVIKKQSCDINDEWAERFSHDMEKYGLTF